MEVLFLRRAKRLMWRRNACNPLELLTPRCDRYRRDEIAAGGSARRRLIAAASRIAAGAARVAAVDTRLTAVAGVLPEANVLVALRLTTDVAGVAPTGRGEGAALRVDHAAERAGFPADIRQAPQLVDPLTVAIAPFRVLGPRGRDEHCRAGDGQQSRTQRLETSVSHDFLLL